MFTTQNYRTCRCPQRARFLLSRGLTSSHPSGSLGPSPCTLLSVKSRDDLGLNICDSLTHSCAFQSAAASVQKTMNFLSVELNSALRQQDERTDSSILGQQRKQ